MVGKISDFLGFIGYKKLILRVSHSNFDGTEKWTGPPMPGISESIPLKFEMTTVDLLYRFNYDAMSIGINYTYYTYGPFIEGTANDLFYDYTTSETYGLVFGIDTFSAYLSNIDNFFPNTGFNLYLEAWTVAGAGTAYDKDKNEVIAFTLRGDYTLGIMYAGGKNRARFGIAAGYNYTMEGALVHHGFQARVAFKY
jgi:hypothetical protein